MADKKEAVKETVEKAADAVKAEGKKAAGAAKKTAAKAETAAKKAVAKTETAAKKAAAKTETAVKKTVKKAAAKVETKKETGDNIVLEYGDKQFEMKTVLEACKADYKAQTKKTAKNVQVYVKPEDNAAYYVVGKFTGKVDL